MNSQPRTRALICLIGLGISLLLVGAVLVARRQALAQATTTFYTPLSGEAKWEGNWEFSELGADPSQAGTERVIIPFTGTDFALRVRRGNYRGYLFVSIDGEPANRLPCEERGAYLVLTSPDYAPQVATIPVATGLDDGPHVAVVVAERGWDQWPLVGWSVSRTPDTTAYRWALVGLGALGLACLTGVIWWGRPLTLPLRPSPSPRLRRAEEGLGVGKGSLLVATLAAAVAFYFSPWLPLTLISGLALAALILLRLDLGLALVAATAPFYLHPRPLFGKAFSMAEITTLLCALSWGFRQLPVWRNQPTPPSTLDLAALFFVAVAIASLFVAQYSHVALRELRVLIVEPALFYLMLRTSHLDERAVWRIVDLFVLGAVAVAIIGLVQYGLGVNVITAEEGFRRLRSVYGSPNSVGLYLGRALPVLVAVTLFGASRGRRVVYGLAVLPLGLAVLLSFSKGALILGVPLSLLALGVLAGGPWSWASLGAVAVAAAAAIPLLRTPRFASLLDTRSGTTFFRLQLWRSSWMMFRDHPWLGVGLDNFLYHYRGRYILPAAWQEPDISQAHNILLDYATRMGIAGLAAGAWLQVAFWRLALPLRRLADPDRRALALGMMASMVNFLAHGLVDASYFLIDLAFVFFLTLGVVQHLARSETGELEI
nr:O-antigen ligase family protein [Anaerolineae bacterium]